MSEVKLLQPNNAIQNSPPIRAREYLPEGEALEAHTSTDMKVKRPKIVMQNLNPVLLSEKTFSNAEADKRIQSVYDDIFESAKTVKRKKVFKTGTKEYDNYGFNFKRYFTIFGIITLLTAAIACIRKIRK